MRKLVPRQYGCKPSVHRPPAMRHSARAPACQHGEMDTSVEGLSGGGGRHQRSCPTPDQLNAAGGPVRRPASTRWIPRYSSLERGQPVLRRQ
jgi:hypothetical protein